MTVVTGNLPVAIAHFTMRTFIAKFAFARICNNEKGHALLFYQGRVHLKPQCVLVFNSSTIWTAE
jgi:hypothetical protein